MSAHAHPRLTPEEYLELERKAEFRHEYFNGRIYMMAGASVTHGLIVYNLSGELRNGLKKSPCFVITNDARVLVSHEGLYTYPDLVVVCDPAKQGGDIVQNPIALIEVLSPSTEAYDRGFKFAQYRKLGSLQEYVLVSQTEPRVEVFRRQESGDWLLSEWTGMESVCRLSSVTCNIPLAEIYDKVTFSAEESDRPSPRL